MFQRKRKTTTYVLHPLRLSISLELSGSSAPSLKLSLVSLVDRLSLFLVDNTIIVGMAMTEEAIRTAMLDVMRNVLPVLDRNLCFALDTIAKRGEHSIIS